MKRIRIKETEADVQKRIVQFLEAHGWLVFQNRSYGLGGKIAAFATKEQAGSPDLFCWKKASALTLSLSSNEQESHHFAIEVKAKGNKQSAAQIAWAGRYCATGHLYVLAYSHEDVEKALRERGWL